MVTWRLSLTGSIVAHHWPSLSYRRYCCVLVVENTVAAVFGTRCTVRRVGENPVSAPPAPAKMAPGSGRFAFHCSFAV